jgi:hypothetical protein
MRDSVSGVVKYPVGSRLTNKYRSQPFKKCCGFGSGSAGSVCFWASRIRIHPSSSKKSKKNLVSTVLWLLYDFLSLKNDVNVPSISRKKKKTYLCWFLENHWRKVQDPDPYQNVRDPQHCA